MIIYHLEIVRLSFPSSLYDLQVLRRSLTQTHIWNLDVARIVCSEASTRPPIIRLFGSSALFLTALVTSFFLTKVSRSRVVQPRKRQCSIPFLSLISEVGLALDFLIISLCYTNIYQHNICGIELNVEHHFCCI